MCVRSITEGAPPHPRVLATRDLRMIRVVPLPFVSVQVDSLPSMMENNASTLRPYKVAVLWVLPMTNLSAETENAYPDFGRAMVTMIVATIRTRIRITAPLTLAKRPSSGAPMADVSSALGNVTMRTTAVMVPMNKIAITKIAVLANSLAKIIGAYPIVKSAMASMIAKITPRLTNLKIHARIATSLARIIT